MSEVPARRPVPRWAVVAVAVLVVLVLGGVVWAAVAQSGSADAGPTSSASPSSSRSAGDDPSASETPVETPTAPAPGEPGGGATDDPDPAAPYTPVTEPAVALDQPATFATGVTAELTKVESVAGEAQGPGEVAGPAVRVTVRLTNGTAAAVPLTSAVVNAYAGQDLAPAEPLSAPGGQPFAGSVQPGATATGVYVFNVPADQRDRLQVTVSYDPTVTTVLFEGPGPSA
ncbi:hypothetical protein OMK64_00795 [Cellulomonas fimi]|uniref:hypothetical protein n=1 Tax=Cellulomonas fimi TaxID=1708 RepID=UPI00234CF378|nr:hypothetical protein [Cellulomonas fimi]MDC7120070.1 hypothetical protein [Cellulomonas fimi]